ncbi:MAG TPA: YdcF family protein [Pyrinomonadaceae bacterium]|nr:YdcF family protein [Pyrinomonadaceae bacterium]
MMLRKLVLSVILATSVFVPNAILSESASHVIHESGTHSALAQAFVQKPALETSGFDSNYKLSLPKPVQDKNFYLLSLFQRRAAVRRVLSQNKALKQLAAAKGSALKKAAICDSVECVDQLFRFDSPTIEAVATALQTLANRREFKLLAKNDLRPSGAFIRYNNQSDAQMLVAAWKDAANGMNRILSVYGLGKDPRYKDIDRVSYDVSTETYRNLLKAKTAEIKFARAPLFFEPTLNFAIKLLEINRRDEAGRYEPLEQGENKAAVQSLGKIKWSDYPYSFILVLGSGGRDLTTRISPIGAQRTDVAARLFLQHKAPLIIVSGGFVHPMQTPYCEAIEMKKYLIEKYQIPESSILVEPHARHTTTNFRNAARLAFRYRIPSDRPALVTSSEDHIASSASDQFRTRNLNELGYFPVEFIKRISPVEAEFKPSVASLFFDANDPLDP